MSNSLDKFLEYRSYYRATDCGRNGKAAEPAIRYAINGDTDPKPAPVGQIDFIDPFGNTVEIKSGAGELPDTFGKDLIYYCPQICDTILMEMQFFVFTQAEWQEFLNGYPSMTATKKSTSGTYRKVLQPLAVSKKMESYVWDVCYSKPTVKDYYNL